MSDITSVMKDIVKIVITVSLILLVVPASISYFTPLNLLEALGVLMVMSVVFRTYKVVKNIGSYQR